MEDFIDYQFKDFNLHFEPDGSEGPAILSGYMTIREALINILFTPVGTRFFNRRFGNMLTSLLFENMNEDTAFTIRSVIAQDLPMFEPRVEVDPFAIEVVPDYENRCYRIKLNLVDKITDQDLTMSAVLERKS